MKIIILEDFKGFVTSIEVPIFPPIYQITENRLQKSLDGMKEALSKVQVNEIRFYPIGDIKRVHGVEVMVYKQME